MRASPLQCSGWPVDKSIMYVTSPWTHRFRNVGSGRQPAPPAEYPIPTEVMVYVNARGVDQLIGWCCEDARLETNLACMWQLPCLHEFYKPEVKDPEIGQTSSKCAFEKLDQLRIILTEKQETFRNAKDDEKVTLQAEIDPRCTCLVIQGLFLSFSLKKK